MACNTCIQNNDCGCNNPCPPELCACPVLIKSDCVDNVTEDLECSGIQAGQTLTEVLVQLDAFICEKFNQLAAFFTLLNVGTGASIYKGVNGVGNKLIRKINALGNLITVTQNTDDISISIDEEALFQAIKVTNVGTGAKIYKGFNNTTNEFEFKSAIVDSQNGIGESFVRDVLENTNDITVRVKKIKSDTLTITASDTEISIDSALTATIPALYVNDLYKPTYEDWVNGGGNLTTNPTFLYRGEGTLAKPFTNSRNYTSTTVFTDVANSAIQNALDGHPTLSYIGTGTRLNPNRVGEKIIIQDNTTFYNFPGNFGYRLLNIDIEANVNSTTTGYLVDMDNILHFNSLSDRVSINVLNGYTLNISGDGFNNSGTNVATFIEAQSKSISLKGRITSITNDISKYLINSDINSTGNNNDGALTFYLDGDIYAEKQGIIRIGGVSRVWNYGNIQSSNPNTTINPALKAYLFLGGSFRSFQNSRLEFAGVRVDGFVFTPTGGFTPQVVLQSTSISSLSLITNLFNKTTTDYANLVVNNSDSSVILSITNIFESPNLWNVVFSNNIFESGTIDSTKADLTVGNLISVSNQIGANIIENLRIFNNRASAISAGVPAYSAFIKRNVFNAVDLLAGVEYKVVAPGSPSLGAIGSFFTATGSETGGGTASLETREILT